MKKSIFFLSIIFIGSLVFSCSEDEIEPTKTELLTNKGWVIQSKIITPSISMNGITISDINIMDSEDVKSYSYKFNSDGTMVISDKSNQSIFQTNWSFNTDETIITFSPGILYSYPIVGDISWPSFNMDLISANQMKSTNPYLYNEINYEITITFIPK